MYNLENKKNNMVPVFISMGLHAAKCDNHNKLNESDIKDCKIFNHDNSETQKLNEELNKMSDEIKKFKNAENILKEEILNFTNNENTKLQSLDKELVSYKNYTRFLMLNLIILKVTSRMKKI